MIAAIHIYIYIIYVYIQGTIWTNNEGVVRRMYSSPGSNEFSIEMLKFRHSKQLSDPSGICDLQKKLTRSRQGVH